MDLDYDKMDGLSMAEAVKAGKVSASELLEEAITRAEAINPKINAIVLRMYDEGRRSVREGVPDGPFEGVPFLLKDLAISYKGFPITHGSQLYKNNVADEDSELLLRWRRAGVTVFGRTNTPEFGILPTTEPELYGATHNPWRGGYSSGGSSGGAAAAVAAGIVPLAHAGDGGGSIRIPSSCCGVFGFKPSRGMTPSGPTVTEQLHGYAIQHVITRSVRDSAHMLDATCGLELTAPYAAPVVERPFAEEVKTAPGRLRIALWTDPLMLAEPADPEVVRAVEATGKLLEELGHEVVVAGPKFNRELFSAAFFRLFCCAAAGEVLNSSRLLGRELSRKDVELTTWMGALFGKGMTGGEFSLALRDMQTVMRDWARFFLDYDALLTPALARLPPKHGSFTPPLHERLAMEAIARANASRIVQLPGVVNRIVGKAYNFSPYTMFANAGGLPSMSVPLAWSREGLPIGSMFTSKFGNDGLLFRLAAQLEQARPWFDKRPPVL